MKSETLGREFSLALIVRLGGSMKTYPKIWGGRNSARVWVKMVSSAAINVFLVYSVMWCGAYVKCDGL